MQYASRQAGDRRQMVLAQTTESTNMIICAVQAQRCRCCRRWSYSVPTEFQKSGRRKAKRNMYPDQTPCCPKIRTKNAGAWITSNDGLGIFQENRKNQNHWSHTGPIFVNSNWICCTIYSNWLTYALRAIYFVTAIFML